MNFDFDQCKSTTLAYYDNWLGIPGCLASDKGSQQIYTTERNKTQVGYSHQMDMYIWVEPGRVIISYGDGVKSKIPALANKLTGTVTKISAVLEDSFGKLPTHAVKYVYQGLPTAKQPEIEPKTLTSADYSDYKRFFLSCFPPNEDSQDDTAWLQEYFEEIVRLNFCVGVYTGGLLASCTDAPSMPYLPDKVQEIGINTLKPYRGRGYAGIVCRKAAENIIKSGRYPIWSHGYGNVGSRRLAESIGFVKLADVLMLTL
ncbi:MAG: GNAT family N-acetyltransferase [Firmicutes bacterium]|nr:GNAT family N-acetyltransferase [Bacillota bacterium]